MTAASASMPVQYLMPIIPWAMSIAGPSIDTATARFCVANPARPRRVWDAIGDDHLRL